ncbi:glycosyltransferase family 2 protein [Kerstersia similis]|uniref:glycosyltransferase family 2 protein n=1 Tax=Kerstersia similis TaxID=206505 RepID=UPI0039EDF318
MQRTDFSIIMPAYNCADTIKESIESVLKQTHDAFELLIINDCSTDDTAAVITEFSERDPRIHILHQANNSGVAKTRNRAIDIAKGQYIAFLDSDDLWLPEKLAIQKRYFDAGHAVVFSSYTRFGNNQPEKTVFSRPFITYKELIKGNLIGNLTGAYDTRKLGKIYQQPVRHEDYLMWLQLLKKSGIAAGIPDVLARYRVREDSISANKLKSALWTWQLYRQHLGLGFFKSASSLFSYAQQGLKKRL